MRRMLMALALTVAVSGAASASPAGFAFMFAPTLDGHAPAHVLVDAVAGDAVFPLRAYLDWWITDATGPSLVSVRGSVALLEVGVGKRLGPVALGIGLRAWSDDRVATHREAVVFYTDDEGRFVPPSVATDPATGETLPGFTRLETWRYWRTPVKHASSNEPALLLSAPVNVGAVAASLHASYGTSGLAWLVTGGVRIGPATLSIGYEHWPMEGWYSGPVAGIVLAF